MTDPSFAGQLITFTYPHIGNYGVSDDGDGVRARSARARRSCARRSTARTRPAREGGWLDWLRDCGIPAITGVDTRALVRHIRDAGAMRGGVFPARLSEAQARELIAAEPSMVGARPRPRGDARRAHRRTRRAPGPRPDRGDRHRHQALDRRATSSSAGATVELHPCTTSAAELLARDARRRLPRQRPRRPGRARLRRRDAARRCVGKVPVFGICLGHQLLCRARRARDVQAALRPPRREPPGQGPADRARSRSPRQNHGFAVSAPTAARRIATDEPVRWETDFGSAVLSHLNLYDRTVEGLALLDVRGRHRAVPPRGGARPARLAVPLRPLPRRRSGAA